MLERASWAVTESPAAGRRAAPPDAARDLRFRFALIYGALTAVLVVAIVGVVVVARRPGAAEAAAVVDVEAATSGSGRR